MKQFFRTLCVGFAATLVAATSFAEGRDVTAKYLRNADMEQGMKYWSLEGEKVLSKNRKNPATQVGFHGMNQGVLEAWNSNFNMPLSNSTTMQRMHNLPNGTYVFGAYVGATNQGSRQRVDADTYRYLYWSNRDSICGVSLYANVDAVPVATDNPDWGGLGQKWAHSSKFNVATKVTDGTLEVGIRVDSTNANYVVWDNATLYYFGDMSEADALDAMAEIDMENAVEIADTMLDVKMNVDTLENLRVAIENAIVNTTTAATLWDDNEMLFWNIGLARKSQNDYAILRRDIETATKVLGYEILYVVDYVSMLEEALEEAQAAYDAAELDRKGLTELRNGLNYYVGAVKFDSLYVALDDLSLFMEEVRNLEGQPGGYSRQQYATLEALSEELIDTICYFEENWGEPYDEELFNPNDLWPYVARVYAAIQNVKDNAISTEYTQMPIEFKQAEDGWIEGAEWFDQNRKIMSYTSPMYRFQNKVETFRITVKKNKNGAAYFCLSELELFDGNGMKIELTEDDVTSNADHNTLNPGFEDGGGFAALFDGVCDDFFHSAWMNAPAEAHYLEVTLPNGGYDAFSFRMLSRSNSGGWDQSHTFPGEMVISTPAPEREALEVWIGAAKNLNPYSFPEVGYYVKDFSYLTDAIAKAEAILAGNPTEEECRAMSIELRQAVLDFEADEDKAIHLPEAGKAYRIVSALPAFYEKQGVEKALTAHMADTTLWWGNVSADSLNQVFVFEPILDEDGEHYVQIESFEDYNGTTWFEAYWCYYMKHVETGRYVDYEDFRTFRLVDEPADTVLLKHLGRGQWNIIVSDYDEFGASMSKCYMHAEEHNEGVLSTRPGAVGGTYGVSSCICNYRGGIDTPSAWYIREMPALPLSVLVGAGEFKSEFIHFEAADIIKLTADKECAFADLALYDRSGNEIAINSVEISGNTATITLQQKLVACAFGFTNNEGVSSVSFDTDEYSNYMSLLQESYDDALALAPVQGSDIGQYLDITAYTNALAAAEAMLATSASDEEILAMIIELEDAVANLVPNMPLADHTYYIMSAMDGFMQNHGVNMMMYNNGYDLLWAYENLYEMNRCWQFEAATEDELLCVGMESDAEAYYIKNVATGLYIADGGTSAATNMTDDKEAAIPYVINGLGSGSQVSLDGLGQLSKRIHANRHASGAGQSGNIVYWNSGAGTASAWYICDAEAYGLAAFAVYSMAAQDVEAKSSSIVNIPVEMENSTDVTAFQFDLYLPDGVSVVSTMEDDEVLYDITLNGDRAKSSHIIAAEPQADGALRIVAYSTKNAPFEGNSGVLLNIAVAVGELEDGDYEIEMRNIRMVTVDEKEKLGADYISILAIENTLPGDVNGDGRFTMIDVVMMVNAVLEKPQANFNASAADMTGDGKITMVDVVGVLRLVLTDNSASMAPARASHAAVTMPELGAGEFAVMGNGRVVLPVALNNSEAYSAFQLDVVLPAGVELAEATLTGRAKASHTIAWNTLADGSVRVVAYAMNNAAFRDNEGALLNLVLNISDAQDADAAILLTDGLFATVGGAEHRAADLDVMMRSDATGVDETYAAAFAAYGVKGAVEVTCGAETVVDIYAVSGQLVCQKAVKAGKTVIALPAGVYMINGNKVIVK